MSKVTLNSLDQKLNDLMDLVKAHVEKDERMFDRLWDHLDGTAEHPGMKTRLDRLEQVNIEHKDHSKMIKTALVSAVIALASSTAKWWVK
jgi:hypothetical protein